MSAQIFDFITNTPNSYLKNNIIKILLKKNIKLLDTFCNEDREKIIRMINSTEIINEPDINRKIYKLFLLYVICLKISKKINNTEFDIKKCYKDLIKNSQDEHEDINIIKLYVYIIENMVRVPDISQEVIDFKAGVNQGIPDQINLLNVLNLFKTIVWFLENKNNISFKEFIKLELGKVIDTNDSSDLTELLNFYTKKAKDYNKLDDIYSSIYINKYKSFLNAQAFLNILTEYNLN